MSKTFKTPKGTELPVLVLKGKDYVQVAHRIVWMREEHPEWGIETTFIQLESTHAIAHATIRDAAGRILAQATKTETPGGFSDYVEKAETGAVGRALAFCGYGTQFAPDMDEGERLVDSPIRTQPTTPNGPQEPTSPPTARIATPPISEPQRVRLRALQNKAKMPDAKLKELIEGFGFDSSKDITRGAMYDAICKQVENYR